MASKDFDIQNGLLIKYSGKEENVVIPEGVVVIKDGALSEMLLAKSITLPSTLRRIGHSVILTDVWGYNYQLEKVIVPSLDTWLNIQFMDEKANLLIVAKNLYIGDELLTKLVIPGKYKKINDYAFANCASIKEVIVEEGVEEIGDDAFCDCRGRDNASQIESVVLPHSLKKLGHDNGPFNFGYKHGVFAGCQKLKSIVIPSQIKILTNRLFQGCSSLTNVELPPYLEEIEYDVFKGCDSLEELNLPSTLELMTISGLKFLKRINIPHGLKKIISLKDCPLIEELYIPDSVKHIKEINLVGLKSIRLPHELEFGEKFRLIDDLALSNKTTKYEMFNRYQGGLYLGNEDNPYLVFVRLENADIEEIALHPKTKYMCTNSFYSYRHGTTPLDLKIKKITLSEGLVWIPDLAFNNCQYLESIAIPDETLVSENAIYNCPKAKVDLGGLFGKELGVIIKEDDNEEEYHLLFKDDKCVYVTYRSDITLSNGTRVKQDYSYANYVFSDYTLPCVFKLFDLAIALINKECPQDGNYLKIKMPNEDWVTTSFDEELVNLLRDQTFDFNHRLTNKAKNNLENRHDYVLKQYAGIKRADIGELIKKAKKEKRYLDVEKLKYLERTLTE